MEPGFSSAQASVDSQKLRKFFDNDLQQFCRTYNVRLKTPRCDPPMSRLDIKRRARRRVDRLLDLIATKPAVVPHPVRLLQFPSRYFSMEEISFSSFIFRGQGHYLKDQPCQDATMFCRTEEAMIFATADGVSQAHFAHLGSRMLLEKCTEFLPALLARRPSGVPLIDPDFLAEIHVEMYFACFDISRHFNLHVLDAWRLLLPTTIKVMIVTPEETIIVGLDDGLMVWQEEAFWLESIIPDRPITNANIPPLLARSPATDLQLQQSYHFHESEQGLAEEAQALYLYAYDSTAEVMPHGVLLCSDGVIYSHEMMPASRWDRMEQQFAFPLFHLFETLTPLDVVPLALLYNAIAEPLRPAEYENVYQLALLRDALSTPDGTVRFAALEEQLKQCLQRVLPANLIKKHSSIDSSAVDFLFIALQLENSALKADTVKEVMDSCRGIIKGILENEIGTTLPEKLLPLWDDIGEIYIFDRERITHSS